jgi:hypothetical protein
MEDESAVVTGLICPIADGNKQKAAKAKSRVALNGDFMVFGLLNL